MISADVSQGPELLNSFQASSATTSTPTQVTGCASLTSASLPKAVSNFEVSSPFHHFEGASPSFFAVDQVQARHKFAEPANPDPVVAQPGSFTYQHIQDR